MSLTTEDRALIAALVDGLPLVERPYEALGRALGWTEAEVIGRLGRLIEVGVISRFGVVVRHHELGIRANAMVVWDVPEERVRAAGMVLRDLPYVTLCYRRPRRPPAWPYNLFCMIHGRDRDTVLAQVETATSEAGLDGLARDVLFSVRRFKQRGARYGSPRLPC